MSTPTYPFDITGLAVTNKIVGENQNLTAVNANPYRLIVPDFAPFHLDNLALVKVDGQGNQTPMTIGVDYNPCMPFLGASRSIGKPLYGGLTINDHNIVGQVKVTYQTLGGEWTADINQVLETLNEMAYNPRTVAWDQVTSVQQTFPPTNHNSDFDYVYGQKDLIDAVDRITAAILSRPNVDQGKVIALEMTQALQDAKLADLQQQINNLTPVTPTP